MRRNLSEAAKARQAEAQKVWHRANLERFHIGFRKGELEKYRRLAASRGVSLASIVKDLLKKELIKEYGPMEMKLIGTADYLYPSTGSAKVDVWETADGRRFCVSEWNGEKWLECWEVFSDMSTGQSFAADPIYRWKAEGMSLDEVVQLEENSAEWLHATEIVGFDF